MDNDTMTPGNRALSTTEQATIAAIKQTGESFIELIQAQPGSREMSLARTKVEEAVMWAVKAVTG